MEKLERVLTAEDEARSALVDARAQATAIRAAALEDAGRIESEAAEASKAAVASERETALSSAGAAAEAIAREGAVLREAAIAAARGRLDDTVRRIAASMEG